MITDWDDAYRNTAYIPGGAGYPEKWATDAAAFRQTYPPHVISYGAHPRMKYDVFLPTGAPKGIAVFVHGGYWYLPGRNTSSHLAAGALARGYAVAIMGYPLAPELRISAITAAIARAIDHLATQQPGQIYLCGHSAGAQLVSRMLCADITLGCADRITHVLAISGVHDLRPLLNTSMNADLRLDLAEATDQSPALHMPNPNARLTAWVGGLERPEFIRQSELIVNIWTGLGADMRYMCMPHRHHFDVIDDLVAPRSAMLNAWLS